MNEWTKKDTVGVAVLTILFVLFIAAIVLIPGFKELFVAAVPCVAAIGSVISAPVALFLWIRDIKKK